MPERETSKFSSEAKTYVVPYSCFEIKEDLIISTNKNQKLISKQIEKEIFKDPNPELFLIAGSWGSGTSAFTGVLKNLGLYIPGPYLMSNDPRTPNTFETQSFRNTVLDLCNESNVSRVQNSSIIYKELNKFKSKMLLDENISQGKSFGLKLPLSAILLPELNKVFKLKLIICIRPFEEIEKSRIRREWPLYLGKMGAQLIYSSIFNQIINSKLPFCIIRYSELISNKECLNCIKKLTSFCDLNPTQKQIKSALEFINSK